MQSSQEMSDTETTELEEVQHPPNEDSSLSKEEQEKMR